MKQIPLAIAAALVAAPAAAQTAAGPMPGMAMPGMAMPAPAKPKAKPTPAPTRKPDPAATAATRKPAAATGAMSSDPHAGHDMTAAPAPTDGADHDMSSMTKPAAAADPAAVNAADPHAGHTMSKAPEDAMQGMAMPGTPMPAPTEEIGTAPAPPPPTDHAADAVWGAAAQAPSRAALRNEHGAFKGTMVLLNLAEYQSRQGSDGYRWEGEGWFGGDINRLVVKSEGEGQVRGAIEKNELQTLYARAIDPWWNLQAGVRYDISPNPQRAYATLGIEGLAPYWFKTSAALFLSNKGELLARVEGFYDQRITQRLVVQPRAEIDFSAQSIPETRVGRGLTDVEFGLRVRYEIKREFAPYVGVEWAARVGETGRFARHDGERTSGFNYVAGIRFWF